MSHKFDHFLIHSVMEISIQVQRFPWLRYMWPGMETAPSQCDVIYKWLLNSTKLFNSIESTQFCSRSNFSDTYKLQGMSNPVLRRLYNFWPLWAQTNKGFRISFAHSHVWPGGQLVGMSACRHVGMSGQKF